MAANLFGRYVWQIDTLRRYKRLTFQEISELWQESRLGYGEELPLRTFHNHQKTIKDIFDVYIECDRKNAAFYIGCIRRSLELYGMEKPDIIYYCSLRAARRIYNFGCNSLDYLCDQFKIPYGQHHRAGNDAEMCARLFLKELKDAGRCGWEGIDYLIENFKPVQSQI